MKKMQSAQTSQRYTLADFEKWGEIAQEIDDTKSYQ